MKYLFFSVLIWKSFGSSDFYIDFNNCKYEQSCVFKTDIDKIKFYSRGINSSNINKLNKIDYEFLECVNHNFPCLYMLKESDKKNISETSGIFLGYGFNVSSLTNEVVKDLGFSDPLIANISKYFGLTGNAAKKKLDEENIHLNKTLLDEFNQKMINQKLSELSGFDDPLIRTLVLSMKLMYGLGEDVDNVILRKIKESDFFSAGHCIKLLSGDSVIRKIQSLAVQAARDKFNNLDYQVSFLFSKNISEYNWEVNLNHFFFEVVKENKWRYNFIRIGINSTSLIDGFSEDQEVIREALSKISSPSEGKINITAGIEEVQRNIQKDAQSIYHKKVVVIIIEEEEIVDDPQKIIFDAESEGYNFIIIAMNKTAEDFRYIRELNTLTFNSFQDFGNKKALVVKTIVYQNDLIRVSDSAIRKNILIQDYDIPYNLEISCDTRSDYKVIVLHNYTEFEKNKFSMFSSSSDPYPDIHNHEIRHFGLNPKSESPFIVVSCSKKEKAYLQIFARNLMFDLNIIRCEEDSEICDPHRKTNGDFGKEKVDVAIYDNKAYSFRNCLEKLGCKFKDDEYVNFYSRGIHPNHIDIKNLHRLFDHDFMRCSIKMITCAYIDVDKGIMIGPDDDNSTLILSEMSKYELSFNENIPFSLMSKLMPLLNKKKEFGFGLDDWKEALESSNVQLNEEEIRRIYKDKVKKTFNHIEESLIEAESSIKAINSTNILSCLFLDFFYESNDLKSVVSFITKKQYDDYLNLFLEESSNLPYRIRRALIEEEINIKKERCIIAIVIGENLLYDKDNILRFIQNSLEKLCGGEAKLRLSIVDENGQALINEFTKYYEVIERRLKRYIKDEPIIKEGVTFNVEDIIKFQMKDISTYDKGIKKVILIISNEDYESSKNGIKFDNKVKFQREVDIESIEVENYINVLFLTSNEGNQYLDSLPKHKVIYSPITELSLAVEELSSVISQLHSKLPMIFRFKKNFFKGRTYYFDIVNQKEHHENKDFQYIQLPNKANGYWSKEVFSPSTKIVNYDFIELDDIKTPDIYLTVTAEDDLEYSLMQGLPSKDKTHPDFSIFKPPLYLLTILIGSSIFVFISIIILLFGGCSHMNSGYTKINVFQ